MAENCHIWQNSAQSNKVPHGNKLKHFSRSGKKPPYMAVFCHLRKPDNIMIQSEERNVRDRRCGGARVFYPSTTCPCLTSTTRDTTPPACPCSDLGRLDVCVSHCV
jgi:hypothetical protein